MLSCIALQNGKLSLDWSPNLSIALFQSAFQALKDVSNISLFSTHLGNNVDTDNDNDSENLNENIEENEDENETNHNNNTNNNNDDDNDHLSLRVSTRANKTEAISHSTRSHRNHIVKNNLKEDNTNDNDNNNNNNSNIPLSYKSLSKLFDNFNENNNQYTHSLDKKDHPKFWSNLLTRYKSLLFDNNDSLLKIDLNNFLKKNKIPLNDFKSSINVENITKLYYHICNLSKNASSSPDISFKQFFETLKFLNSLRIKEIKHILIDLYNKDSSIIEIKAEINEINTVDEQDNDDEKDIDKDTYDSSLETESKRGDRSRRPSKRTHSRSGSESLGEQKSRRLRHSTRSSTRSPSPWSLSKSPINSIPIKDPQQLQLWKKSAIYILERILEHKCASIFQTPIKDLRYQNIIKKPMHLDLIKSRIKKGIIKSTNEFHRDLMLILSNAIIFNGEDSDISIRAIELREFIQSEIVTLQESTSSLINNDDNST